MRRRQQPAAKAPANQLIGFAGVAHLCLCPWNIGSPQLLLQADLKPIVLAVPLLERGGINLHNGILHQRLCAHLQATQDEAGSYMPGFLPKGQWQQAGCARSLGTVGKGMFHTAPQCTLGQSSPARCWRHCRPHPGHVSSLTQPAAREHA